MSYLHHWRLNRSPFAAPVSASDTFAGGSVDEAAARAHFLIQHERRLGLVVGPRGGGKSTFLQLLATQRPHANHRSVVRMDLLGTSPILMAERVRDALLREPTGANWLGERRNDEPRSLGRLIHEIDDFLVAEAALNRHSVLLVDNAEDASEETLEAFGMLLKRPGRWSVVLTVEDSLLVELPRRILEACELRIDLPAWDLGQTAEFFEFSLARCGKRAEVFSAQAITRIHELSDGIVRRIAQLADLSLVAGAVRKQTAVDADVVDQVFDEFSIRLGPNGLASHFQLM